MNAPSSAAVQKKALGCHPDQEVAAFPHQVNASTLSLLLQTLCLWCALL
jgi:hypothetical protein